MPQNFKNHSRYLPLYHFVIPVLLLLLIIGASIDLVEKVQDKASISFSLYLITLVACLLFIWFYSRAFALKAQDRVIVLEEKLRHQQLTGSPLPKLLPAQIIALRFAGDAEFPVLAQKAAAENLSGSAIKQSIQTWKADHYRV
jgi:hypothetical protein